MVHGSALLTIVLMALVTYALRAGGYWLMGRVALSPRLEVGLSYLPGAVLTALVVPATIQAGIPGVVALATVAVVMRRRGNLFLALVAGVAVVWLVRQMA